MKFEIKNPFSRSRNKPSKQPRPKGSGSYMPVDTPAGPKKQAACDAIRKAGDYIKLLDTDLASKTSMELHTLAGCIEHGGKFNIARATVHALIDLHRTYKDVRDNDSEKVHQIIDTLVEQLKEVAPGAIVLTNGILKEFELEYELDPKIVDEVNALIEPAAEQAKELLRKQGINPLLMSGDDPSAPEMQRVGTPTGRSPSR